MMAKVIDYNSNTSEFLVVFENGREKWLSYTDDFIMETIRESYEEDTMLEIDYNTLEIMFPQFNSYEFNEDYVLPEDFKEW